MLLERNVLHHFLCASLFHHIEVLLVVSFSCFPGIWIGFFLPWSVYYPSASICLECRREATLGSWLDRIFFFQHDDFLDWGISFQLKVHCVLWLATAWQSFIDIWNVIFLVCICFKCQLCHELFNFYAICIFRYLKLSFPFSLEFIRLADILQLVWPMKWSFFVSFWRWFFFLCNSCCPLDWAHFSVHALDGVWWFHDWVFQLLWLHWILACFQVFVYRSVGIKDYASFCVVGWRHPAMRVDEKTLVSTNWPALSEYVHCMLLHFLLLLLRYHDNPVLALSAFHGRISGWLILNPCHYSAMWLPYIPAVDLVPLEVGCNCVEHSFNALYFRRSVLLLLGNEFVR